MSKLLSNVIKIVIGITGLLADLLTIYDHLPYLNHRLPKVQLLPPNPTTSLILIFYGLTAVGVIFWAWLDSWASTPFEGIRLFFFVQLLCASFLLYLHLQAFGGSITLVGIVVLIAFVIVSEIISWQVYSFFTLRRYLN